MDIKFPLKLNLMLILSPYKLYRPLKCAETAQKKPHMKQ